MQVLQAFKPNLAECICDTIPAAGQTEKRIRKSVDRTLKFLDKCIEEKELSKVGKWQAMLQFLVAFTCALEFQKCVAPSAFNKHRRPTKSIVYFALHHSEKSKFFSQN